MDAFLSPESGRHFNVILLITINKFQFSRQSAISLGTRPGKIHFVFETKKQRLVVFELDVLLTALFCAFILLDVMFVCYYFKLLRKNHVNHISTLRLCAWTTFLPSTRKPRIDDVN